MAKAKLTLKQEADMLSAVNQIKELEAAGKQLKKQADELRSQVKAMMDKKHLEEMDVGNFTVNIDRNAQLHLVPLCLQRQRVAVCL